MYVSFMTAVPGAYKNTWDVCKKFRKSPGRLAEGSLEGFKLSSSGLILLRM
jgi:hypothetical protein